MPSHTHNIRNVAATPAQVQTALRESAEGLAGTLKRPLRFQLREGASPIDRPFVPIQLGYEAVSNRTVEGGMTWKGSERKW
jgi:hypothetical protein